MSVRVALLLRSCASSLLVFGVLAGLLAGCASTEHASQTSSFAQDSDAQRRAGVDGDVVAVGGAERVHAVTPSPVASAVAPPVVSSAPALRRS